MRKKRNKLIVVATACAALAVGVPGVAASSSSEQPAPAGQSGEVVPRASKGSGGEGDIVAAAATPRIDAQPAPAPQG